MNKKVLLILLITLTLVSCTNETSVNNTVEIELSNLDEKIDLNAITEKKETDKIDEITVETETDEVDETTSVAAGANEEKDSIKHTIEDIKWLQESLKIAEFYTSMDGHFGNNTKDKLIAFQESIDGLSVTGVYDFKTKQELKKIREKRLAPGLGTDLVLINKGYYLPSEFIPKDLIEVNVKTTRYIELSSHVALKTKEMFDAAKLDGYDIYLLSGYRSYEYQEGIFSRRVNNYGFDEAQKVVAIPGESEHQTGLAIDVTSESMGFGLNQNFEEKDEFTWLKNNCYKFGFILRYQKNKEDITGYIYEPWHYRYIGDIEAAKHIMENNLVLEEYYDSIDKAGGNHDE